MQVGVIQDWTSTAPVLSIGNAVDLKHPFGVISDFRVYQCKIPENMLIDNRCPFNISPRSRIFLTFAQHVTLLRVPTQDGRNEADNEDYDMIEGENGSKKRRTSLRSTTLNASQALQSKQSKQQDSRMNSTVKIDTIHPWTLLQESYVHYKLGEDDQGVSLIHFNRVLFFDDSTKC